MKTLVTLDTNVLRHSEVSKIEQALQGLPIELTHVSVTAREFEGTDFTLLGRRVVETGVWGESRWDQSLYSDAAIATLFEQILGIMSEGAFPRYWPLIPDLGETFLLPMKQKLLVPKIAGFASSWNNVV
jgi:hypothetical protein